MGMLTAPYTNAMRLGSGFNSFTQSLCVNDAVIKDNRKSATEDDLRVVRSGSGDGETSQIVTWSAAFVEHASEVSDSMDIKGSVQIKVEGLGGGGGSLSYLNTEQVKDSDINYLLTVKVVNQKLVANDVTRFNPIPNLASSAFTDTYGDTFISGFVEGGEFYALMSIKVTDKSKIQSIKGSLNVEVDKGAVDVKGDASVALEKSDLMKDTITTINVTWSGGGQIRPPEDVGQDWTFASMKRAANSFPEKVAIYPQRTQAILTKYGGLRSYQEMTNKGSPLDYENAGVYTNALLDAYMDYKSIWKLIASLQNDANTGRALKARPDKGDEFYQYSQDARADYIQKMKAFYYPDMDVATLDKATKPALPSNTANGATVNGTTTNGTTSGALVKAGGADSSGNLSKTIDDMDKQLAKVSNDIIVAKKKLLSVQKGELFEPPLKPNPLKPYPATIIGLDAARRDCRWEMIKIVKEVDAVTNDPQVAIDTDRVWQYLNPIVFRQLIPTLNPPPPPYPQDYFDEVMNKKDELFKAKQKELDDTVIAKDKEIADQKEHERQAIADQKELERQHIAAKDEEIAATEKRMKEAIDAKDNEIQAQIEHEGRELAAKDKMLDELRDNEKNAVAKAIEESTTPLNKAISSQNARIDYLTEQVKIADTTNAEGPKAVRDLKELQAKYDVVKATLDGFQRDNAQYTRELITAVARVGDGSKGPPTPIKALDQRPYYAEAWGGVQGATNFTLEEIVTFNPPLERAPQVLCSLTWVEFNNQKDKDGTGMTCRPRQITNDGFVLCRGVGDQSAQSMCSMWLALPDNGIHMESGTMESAGVMSQLVEGKDFRQKVKFRKPFTDPPKVVAWFMGGDFPSSNKTHRMQIQIEEVNGTDCLIHVHTWFESVVRNIKIGWLAYDSAEHGKRIKSGTSTINFNGCVTADKPLARDVKLDCAKVNTKFEGQRFSREPAMFLGYTTIDMQADKNWRTGLSWHNTNQDSFDLTLSTWSDTLLWQLDAVWVAME